jgi:hypothetical protein
VVWFLSGAIALANLAERDGQQQHEPADDLLVVGVHAQQRQAVVEHAQNHHADLGQHL